MIICSQPECQTTAGCTCTNRLFDYSRLRGEVAAKEAELSALKKQVEELTAERDDARRYAVEARLRENQAEDRRVSESFARAKAEAEAAALRPLISRYIVAVDDWLHQYAPEECREEDVKTSRNRIRAAGGTLAYIAGMQHLARAALASTRETSDA